MLIFHLKFFGKEAEKVYIERKNIINIGLEENQVILKDLEIEDSKLFFKKRTRVE